MRLCNLPADHGCDGLEYWADLKDYTLFSPLLLTWLKSHWEDTAEGAWYVDHLTPWFPGRRSHGAVHI